MNADIKDEALKQEINDVFSSCYTEESTLLELVDNFIKIFGSNEKIKEYFDIFKFSFLFIMSPDEFTEPYYQAYEDYSAEPVDVYGFKKFLEDNKNIANLKIGQITHNYSHRFLSFSCIFICPQDLTII